MCRAVYLYFEVFVLVTLYSYNLYILLFNGLNFLFIFIGANKCKFYLEVWILHFKWRNPLLLLIEAD